MTIMARVILVFNTATPPSPPALLRLPFFLGYLNDVSADAPYVAGHGTVFGSNCLPSVYAGRRDPPPRVLMYIARRLGWLDASRYLHTYLPTYPFHDYFVSPTALFALSFLPPVFVDATTAFFVFCLFLRE